MYAQRIQPDTLWLYEDKTGKLTLTDIKQCTDFTPVNGLNFGYNPSAFWVKFPLKNYFNGRPFCVVARHPTVWALDFYLVQNDSVVAEKLIGLSRPRRNNEVLLDRYFLEVQPAAGQTVYVRMQEAGASLHNEIYLQQKWDMHREATIAAMLYYISAGAVLVLFIYSLFKFIILRKKLFLYYGIWIVSIIFFLWLQIEFAYHYLPESWINFTHQLRFFMMVPLLVFWLLFTKQVLALSETGNTFTQKAYYVLLRVYPLYLLPLVLNLAGLSYSKAPLITLFYILIIGTFWVVIYSAVLSARSGHRPAKYFLIGQIPFVVAYSIIPFRNFGLLPNSEVTLFVPSLCLMFEMAVMFICMERHYHFEKVIEKAVADTLPEQTVLETLVNETIETTGKEEIGTELLELFERIKAFFDGEKVYLNADLKLSDVAGKLDVPAYQISKCINLCSNMHFFDFVNSYRVEAAKALIKTEEINQKYTIEYIAAKSGFNSKSTFNGAFKKFTGMTPSQYRTTPTGA
jgi:AraC-like DNA-binding protein